METRGRLVCAFRLWWSTCRLRVRLYDSTMTNRFLTCLREAVPGAVKSTTWLLKLMIPISLAVTLLQYFGILDWAARYLHPVFAYMGLPGASAVAYISGAAAGTYAGVAAMMSMPLTMREVTIISIMVALCHALPMECAVNKMTGSSFWKMCLVRIVMAFVSAVMLNAMLPEMNEPFIYLGVSGNSTFGETMKKWAISQLEISLMVAAIIYALMYVQRLIEAFGLLRPLSRFFAPLMKLFGLPREAAYLWLVGNVLGISYGSAVMVELEDKGIVTRDEANDTNYHLIMNHSLLEDTVVFSSIGVSPVLLVSVRVGYAMVVVWCRKAVKYLALRMKAGR